MYIALFRKSYLIFILLLVSTLAFSQDNWTSTEKDRIDTAQERRIIPKEFGFYQLDTTSFKALLATAPHENDVFQNGVAPLQISLPNPDGEVVEFNIVAYDLMQPELAAEWSHLKNWRGWQADDPTTTIRLDWTARGFHAMILERGNFWFIDPYYWTPDAYYQVFYKKDYPAQRTPFACHATTSPPHDLLQNTDVRTPNGDCNLRTYRLALACTGEYAIFHGGGGPTPNTALVASAINTSLNRVNGIYESELALRLVLIANNNNLIYTNPASDPYTNGSGGTMLGENQNNIDNVIGSANYDIGHVYSTGGGGVAYLGSACNNSLKAGGVTGRPNPVGDPFDVDYVAHEMGHQFGANHTQNNSCNRNSSTAMEPGSASTIMGYAGICPANVQSNSDAYYHAISLQEIANHMELGGGNSCAMSAGIPNGSPVNVDAGESVTIPHSTPFVLTASATDPNGDPLTYNWEQFDNSIGQTMPPEGTNTLGPMFRSYFATSSPSRYFPRLSDLVAGIDNDWEELPTVGRTMTFRVTARDFNGVYGCNAYDDVNVTVAGNSGPFVVNNPNTNINWEEGQTATVEWDVAGTNLSPVSCDNVNILLSLDGGFSYPTTLASNIPNNGSTTITVPAGTSTTARVMVVCSDNVFFDISDVNFNIVNAQAPGFVLSPASASYPLCVNTNDAITFTTSSAPVGGLTGNITLSDNAAEQNITSTYSATTIAVDGMTTVTLSGLSSLTPGTYEVIITGVQGNLSSTAVVNIIIAVPPNTATLTTPIDNATGVPLIPNFEWAVDPSITTTAIEVSTDQNFNNIVFSTPLGTDNSANPSAQIGGSPLDPQTLYYWRVRSSNESCEVLSPVNSFMTAYCNTYSSTDVPVTIPNNSTGDNTSTLTITEDISISSISVVNLAGTHTWIEDMSFALISPNNTSIPLINNVCGDSDDFLVNFDDNAAASLICPLNQGQFLAPTGQFSTLNNSSAQGTWTLFFNDNFNQDGGSLNAWSLRVCSEDLSPLPLEWLKFTATAQEKSILLAWTTADEFNTSHFDIERSEDGRSFVPIGKVLARNTAIENDYQLEDEGVRSGVRYYYRIKQVDLDGTFTYSEIRTAILDGFENNVVIIPNPNNGQFTINNINTQSVKSIQLYNTLGQKIQSSVDYTANHIEIEMTPTAPNGTYFISIVWMNGEITNKRFVHSD